MITLATELADRPALTLAPVQFVKRVGRSEMRGCAVDDDEAAEIRGAIEQLMRALAETGFSAR
jgi:hypothetical protein